MILLLPFNLDLNNLLNSSPPNPALLHRINTVASKNKVVDKLSFIVDSILRQMSMANDLAEPTYGMRVKILVPLYSPILVEIIGDNYRNFIDYLVQNNVIFQSDKIASEGQSHTFGLHRNYWGTGVKPHEVLDFKLKQKLEEQQSNFSEEKTTYFGRYADSKKILEAMARHFGKLTIDFDAAIAKLGELRTIDIAEIGEEEANVKYQARLYPLFSLKNEQIKITRDENIQRVHTPVVTLKRELRHFLKYNGQSLVNIDISNSQPYFLNKFFEKGYFKSPQFAFNDDFDASICAKYAESGAKDIEEYKQLTAKGQLYEAIEFYLGKELAFSNRNELKKAVLTTFYSTNKSRDSDVVKIRKVLMRNFPAVYDITREIKKNNYKQLSLLLQRIESEVMIDMVAYSIVKKHPKKPFFTVHDSIICLKEDEELFKPILKEIIESFVGNSVNVKCEDL